MADMTAAVKTSMEDASALSGNSVVYDVTYDDATHRFSIGNSGGLTGLDLLWGTANGNNSIGNILGFDAANDTGGGLGPAYPGDSAMVLMTFDSTNNAIDFEEISIDGRSEERRVGKEC